MLEVNETEGVSEFGIDDPLRLFHFTAVGCSPRPVAGSTGAATWRMSTADYLAALEMGDSEPLRSAVATSPWEPRR